MQQMVILERDQQITDEDMNKLGSFPREAFDLLVSSAIEPGLKYTGFNVIQSGPATVTVGSGLVYNAGKVFMRDDEGGVDIDLIPNIPAIGNKWVVIVAFGQEIDTEVEPRTFLVDPVTRATEARAVPTVNLRYANVDKVVGAESTSPLVPAVGANVVAIADVLLTPAGISSITMREDNQLESLRQLADKLIELGLWRAQVGARLETIQTDITGLSDRLKNTARVESILELSRDVGNLKAIAGLPEEYSSYGFDPFLALEQSNTDVLSNTGNPTHPNLDVLVEEGARMPAIATHSAQLNLLNSDDVKVKLSDKFIIPAYSEVARISSIGRDDEISLSQYTNQTVDLVQRTVSRYRVRWGAEKTVCTNNAWWKTGRYDPVTGIFYKDGDTWQVAPGQNTAGKHTWIRLQQFWTDSYTESYWDKTVVETSVNGSIIGQTFLSSQETWLTAIGLYFTRKGNANVTLALTEVNDAGAPDLSKTLAQVTVPVADIQLYPLQTKVPMPLTLLERGKRYAIVPISTGAHFLALTQNNKFGQGSLFTSTDASWFQGDLMKDLAFVIYAAAFSTPRVEVQLEPWELTGGIFGIDVLADAVIPNGCAIVYELRINNVWVPVSAAKLDQLASLPPLLQARVVFQGTTDLMPRLGVQNRSRVITSRPKQAFTHITDVISPPAPVNTVWVDIRLESFDPAHNTAVVKLLSGVGYATTTLHSVLETTPDDTDEKAFVRRYIFSFGAPISSFKIRIEGTTDAISRQFHVAHRSYVALNV